MLRGINVGGRRRLPMAELRALLTDAGHTDVATYVQSGSVVLADAKRHQVTFLSAPVADAVRARIESATLAPERVACAGREVYAWHPDGVARSKLWNVLGGSALGVVATTRNWATVTALAEMAGSGAPGRKQ